MNSKNVSVDNVGTLFRSKYSGRKQYTQDLSREVEPIYELNDEGNPVQVGESNIYEQIQVCKDETLIYNVLKRYESGDFAVIGNPNDGLSGDFTSVPTDLLSSCKNMDVAIDNWSKLPQGLRDLYNNNVLDFMKATPDDINLKVNSYVESLNTVKKEDDK